MNIFFANRFECNFIAKIAVAIVISLFISRTVMASPIEVTFSNVENCQFLGKVEGSSGYGKNNGWQHLAKFSAFRLADKLGASHIVLERMITIGAFNGIVVARAYKCGG
jgi:hypothetical protein